MSNHPMDDRREYRHGTLVYSDRYGPREFWRGGEQVGCICDPGRGITCAYHGRLQEQAPPPPRKASRRAQRVAGHLAAGDDPGRRARPARPISTTWRRSSSRRGQNARPSRRPSCSAARRD